MTKSNNSNISRRLFATSAVAFGLAAPSVLRAQEVIAATDSVDIVFAQRCDPCGYPGSDIAFLAGR